MKHDPLHEVKKSSSVKEDARHKPDKKEDPFFSSITNKHGFFAGNSSGPDGEVAHDNKPVMQRKDAPLPDEVQAKMESAFNQDFSTISIHTNSAAANNLNALAYTQGEDIHFAPGQFEPASSAGQELIGHELAHVVQQRQGRVAPTVQTKEISINNNNALEQEAAGMGRKAAASESIPYRSNSLAIRNNLRTTQLARKGVIQLAPVPTNYGEFKDIRYNDVGNYGVDIELEFHPGTNVNAKKIGLTQVVRSIMGGVNVPVTPTQDLRMTASGRYLDRIATRNNPVYGGQQLNAKDGLEKTNPSGSNYHLGWNYTDAAGPHKKEAFLSDRPTRPGSGKNTEQVFETTALALEGQQAGLYYGSVQWGYRVDGSNTFSRLPLTLVSKGVPSAQFIEAAMKWNAATSQGTIKTRANPTEVFDDSYAVAFTVPSGTTVSLNDLGIYSNNNTGYNSITIVDGARAGQGGKVKIADMRDQGNGSSTIDLPIVDVFIVNNPAGATLNDGLMGPWRYSDNLPQNTRLRIIDSSHIMGPFQTNTPFDYKAEVEVVDGPHTGKTGWLNYSDLINEP